MSTAECVVNEAKGNVGLAFGIVTASGLSTTIGAALAFVMPYSRDAKNLFLAACLAIAAGVMIYVSFVEIFAAKAVEEFKLCYREELAYLYATLCFFGGILITYVFDRVLHVVQSWLFDRKKNKGDGSAASSLSYQSPEPQDESDIERPPHAASSNDDESPNQDDDITEVVDGTVGHGGHLVASMYTDQVKGQDSAALIRMGMFAGIALAFHNFPEGLATFVSVLEDPSVGASVAIAIGIHNIPEGVCVAMPIYYATGSRWKAFAWATLSGMTELVGAFLGWVVLKSVITPMVYGLLFGIVAGMMVYISLKELIPTAHRYDPDDQVTSLGIVAGMIAMAVSLVLFMF